MSNAPNLAPKSRVVLDSAHVGDIKGALGTIRWGAERPRGFRGRLLALLAIAGPGIIVMVGDNDAGGVATYSQAGQDYGTTLLWVLVLLIPVLIVNQEMVVRLGAVTGTGHGKMIFERFGRFWGIFSVGDLFILNFLTLVTEFIGVSLAAGYFGISAYIAVPLMGLLLIAVTVTGSFERWERFMFVFIAANVLIIPLVVLSRPHVGPILHDFVVPGIEGGLTGNSILLIIAIVGTTVAPWQLFFQQSNIVDKRITPQWIPYEEIDTIAGSFVTVAGASAVLIVCAFAFLGTHYAGQFVSAGTVATDLSHTLGGAAGAMYAIVLLNASLIGAAALSISTSYAFGDTFGVRHSLHWRPSEAKGFYSTYVAMVVGSAVIVLLPHAPLGLITTAVQAMAGVLLPSATVFLLLLCNDRAVLGPWVNPGWLNAISVTIIAILLTLSAILTVTTLFPAVNVPTLVFVLGAVTAGALLIAGAIVSIGRRTRAGAKSEKEESLREKRATWTMPPLALLEPPRLTPFRRVGLTALRVYLVVAVVLLLVKTVQLATGHP